MREKVKWDDKRKEKKDILRENTIAGIVKRITIFKCENRPKTYDQKIDLFIIGN
jgi:hypothetical protein